MAPAACCRHMSAPPAAARPPDPCHWIYFGQSGGRPPRHQFRHPALCRSPLPLPAVVGPAAALVGGLPPAAPLSAAHERSAEPNSGPPAASHSSRGGFEAQREIALGQRSGGPAKARRWRRKRRTSRSARRAHHAVGAAAATPTPACEPLVACLGTTVRQASHHAVSNKYCIT